MRDLQIQKGMKVVEENGGKWRENKRKTPNVKKG